MIYTNKTWFQKGMRDGIPISLGYFAVSLALGIAARNAGLSAPQATLASFLLNASAGEYVGFTLIAAGAGYLEVALMEMIANARYLLMSCSLSQKLSPDTPLIHRMLIGYAVTDEIFGISVTVPGNLSPYYTFGAMLVAIPGWSSGTFLGVVLGNILSARVVSALSVGLFGMFIAIIIPPARKDKIIAALVVISFALSFAFNKLSLFDGISSGVKTIILTVVISGAAAVFFPIRDTEERTPAVQTETEEEDLSHGA